MLGTSVEDCDRTIYLASYIGVGAGKNFVRLELYSTVSLFGFFETFDIDKLISLPNGINIIEFGPRPHQRAAVFSLSGKKRIIDKGFDVKTQTYGWRSTRATPRESLHAGFANSTRAAPRVSQIFYILTCAQY